MPTSTQLTERNELIEYGANVGQRGGASCYIGGIKALHERGQRSNLAAPLIAYILMPCNTSQQSQHRRTSEKRLLDAISIKTHPLDRAAN
jgi:hypothetical protein